jgi:hypothetical protein
VRTACVTQADGREEERGGTSYTEWPYGSKIDTIRRRTGGRRGTDLNRRSICVELVGGRSGSKQLPIDYDQRHRQTQNGQRRAVNNAGTQYT